MKNKYHPIMLHRLFLVVLLTLLYSPLARAKVFTSDICVYGSTSGGAVAAVQAARMGKSVMLVDPGNHLGGMTSGGLGWVDFGNPKAIGGMSREFFDRVIQHYAGIPKSEWRQGAGWTFEPHVAEGILRDMITEAKVPVQFGEELASAQKEGGQIKQLTMANGDVFRAKIFIDATYEGDLMAAAKVSYTITRESNAQYKETHNGIHVKPPIVKNTPLRIDPYLRPGDPSSGLIPLIQTDPPGQNGDSGPEGAVQAYNYRLCLTQDSANRLPIAPPPDYDPARYELFARYIDALKAANLPFTLDSRSGQTSFLKIDRLPNKKTDVNNDGCVSTDYVGFNGAYVEGDAATRKKIAKEHENYMRGMIHFLATDSRVPENLRTEMQKWGLCRDEFQDTGGWPFQLYVRESRRMIGTYVMTEHDCWGQTKLDDSIGEGSYALDSHSFRRIVRDGIMVEDGGGYVALKHPYPISYRAITPKEEECTNLLVPACLSASHAAYSSMRMEPVFMILGQSAGTAASIALDDNVPVQKVDMKKLQARLLADKQVLGGG
jgi:hypothetical protein